MTFYPTKHFHVRHAERRLNTDDIKAAILSPTKRKFLKKGKNGGRLTRFEKTAGGKTLVVIAEIKAGECWIVTAYYEN